MNNKTEYPEHVNTKEFFSKRHTELEENRIKIVGPEGIRLEITLPYTIESDEEYYALLKRIGTRLINMETNVVAIANISEK